MRGRLPKPTILKIVGGNPGKRKLSTVETIQDTVVLGKPKHLFSYDAVAWKYASELIAACGVVTQPDAIALEALVSTLSRKWHAEYALGQPIVIDRELSDGSVISQTLCEGGQRFYHREGARGLKYWCERPEVEVIAQAVAALNIWVAKFGLSPADRARLHHMPKMPTNDPFDEF
jgi:phage terminase small subunit